MAADIGQRQERMSTQCRVGLFEMANDYIKFSRPEFEVVGGNLDLEYANLMELLIIIKAISHQ